MSEPITSVEAAVRELPVGPGPLPRTLDVVEEELTGVSLSLFEEEQDNARLRLALASAQRGRRDLRARASELEGMVRDASSYAAQLEGRLREIEQTPFNLDAEVSADKLTRLLAPTQALREDPHDSPLHRDWRLGRDLPEMGGSPC
jgi:hypothetical protein